MAGLLLVGLIALVIGIVRTRRSEKGSRKRRRSRTLAWIGGIAMVYGFAALPVAETVPDQTTPIIQEQPQKTTPAAEPEPEAESQVEAIPNVKPEPEPPAEFDNSTGQYQGTDVRIACEDGIKGLLAAPQTAKFPGFWAAALDSGWGRTKPERSGDDTYWYWNVEVESQNAFGNAVYTRWSCIFEDDGTWTVEQVQ